MITQKQFEEKCAEFGIEEGRAGFYEMAKGQSLLGFKAEACVILMGTWNFAAWRYGVKEFDRKKYDYLMHALSPIFQELSGERFETANYTKLEGKIERIYEPLSKIKGIEYTGATKLMLIENPRLFMPWDQYIRKEYNLSKDGKAYSSFLATMQKEYGHLTAPVGKTLPKAIDEYNYVTISIPAMKEDKKKKMEAKEKKKEAMKQFKEWRKKQKA